MSLRQALGIDGPVAYTFMARAVNILGSTGTVLLIVRYLSPVEQGYYYTLLSLVSLQLVFELGFSFVIQQLAAHECVHLRFYTDGKVSGDRKAHARLASALKLSMRWYTVAAVAMVAILIPAGMIFFARQGATGRAHVAWQGPWIAAVILSAVSLWCMPFYSFIEGCGQIKPVAAMRFRQAIVTSTLAWIPMLLHHGLYSPAMAIVGYTAAGLSFLAGRRRLLLGLLRHSACDAAIGWGREVWPFQWRIAISSMCSYFAAQIFIPILFAVRGAVEAGQVGMSLSITGYMTVLALSWSSTKTTPFGRMIAQQEFRQADTLFLRTLGHSLAIFGVMALAATGMVSISMTLLPSLAVRMVSPQLFAALVLAAGANCVVQSLATLLRSFKREPFLIQSLAVALLSIFLVALTAPRWGNAGAVFSYLSATAFVALPSALIIFVRARRGYLALNAFAV